MILESYVRHFLLALSLAVVVETGILLVLSRYFRGLRGTATSRILWAGLFANLLTVPYVWFVFPFVLDWTRSASLMFSEPFAFLVEAVFYRKFLRMGWGESLIVSLAANVASFALGRVLWGYLAVLM